jgi:cytochrome c-type biogenesis protein CcmH/NrfF
VLWVLPFAGIIVVGGLLVWGMRRSAAKAQAAAPAAPALTPQQRERLERDLQRFKEED